MIDAQFPAQVLHGRVSLRTGHSGYSRAERADEFHLLGKAPDVCSDGLPTLFFPSQLAPCSSGFVVQFDCDLSVSCSSRALCPKLMVSRVGRDASTGRQVVSGDLHGLAGLTIPDLGNLDVA